MVATTTTTHITTLIDKISCPDILIVDVIRGDGFGASSLAVVETMFS